MIREQFSQWQNFHSLENYQLKTGHSFKKYLVSTKKNVNSKVK